ncbi:MAG: retropepsin-like aspartic protease family protein [Pararhizobium sp.]
MRRSLIFPVLIGILGTALVLLVFNNGGGRTFGIANDAFASTIALGAWAAVLAAGIIHSGRIGEFARNMMIWLFAILALTAVYIYRYDLQEFGARMTAGLIPGLPVTRTGLNGVTEIILHKSGDGHFKTIAWVNGHPVHFLVDTGASQIVLSYQAAQAIGLKPKTLSFTQTITTANGKAKAAAVVLHDVALGPIHRDEIDASVSAPGMLDESLLGMNFLETLSSLQMSRDVLILHD